MNELVLSFVGKQGAGKSTIAKYVSELLSTGKIETSDIVKKIYHNLSRSELPSTGKRTKTDPNWLARALERELKEEIRHQNSDIVVLSGVREIEIHKYFLSKRFTLHSFEVIAAPEVRYTRLLEMHKVRNAEEFLDQERRELTLGVAKVEEEAAFRIPTSPNTEPSELAASVVKRLREKKVV